MSNDTYIYIAQFDRFARVSMSIIADKEFRMIKRLLSAELEDIDSCRVGTCNIRFGGQNWYDKYVLYLFSTMLLKTAHTLLLKYDIRNRYRSTVSYTYIRALLITTITYCTCLNALVAEKLGIDRQLICRPYPNTAHCTYLSASDLLAKYIPGI